ncbi:MAG: cytochrome-c peroxidase [Flavobacteriales bacterium]|nr:cytochrome-c peroxidase [Flavobacteriales bacterium]
MPRIAPLTIALLLLALACGRSRQLVGTSEPHGPTRLELTIPAWALDTAHPLNLPYDNPLTVEGVALGRRLFHEPLLSGDGTLSCASCHQQKQAFSDARNFPTAYGNERNSMPLLNLAWDHYFFWDARALSLELQAFEPVTAHQEMNSDWRTVVARLQAHPAYPALFLRAFGSPLVDSLHVAYALAQFERTLLSFGSRFDQWRYAGMADALDDQEQRGWQVFSGKGHCIDCHTPPRFTDGRVVNIGLETEPVDNGLGARTGIAWHMGRFKTPSLRNLAVTAPYMHDGRFATLEEVVEFYATGVSTDAATLDAHMEPWVKGQVLLTRQDRSDLVAFLRTLTDEAFLADPRFGPQE